MLFKSYLPGHLRKRGAFRDQLVVPEALVGLILHALTTTTSCQEDTSHPDRLTTKPARDIGGLR